jgi:hypothetical protein
MKMTYPRRGMKMQHPPVDDRHYSPKQIVDAHHYVEGRHKGCILTYIVTRGSEDAE